MIEEQLDAKAERRGDEGREKEGANGERERNPPPIAWLEGWFQKQECHKAPTCHNLSLLTPTHDHPLPRPHSNLYKTVGVGGRRQPFS